jgi:hypothetical protein
MEKTKLPLVIGLVALAMLGRLIPHPENFTPVLAVALFGGAMLPLRLALGMPLAALIASDLLLGQALDAMSLVVYGCFLAAVGIGQWLGKRRTWTKTGLAAVGGSLLFFLVTNFAVWLGGDLYPMTGEGVAECYVMALPFFRNALAGDLFWSALLFLVYDFSRSYAIS